MSGRFCRAKACIISTHRHRNRLFPNQYRSRFPSQPSLRLGRRDCPPKGPLRSKSQQEALVSQPSRDNLHKKFQKARIFSFSWILEDIETVKLVGCRSFYYFFFFLIYPSVKNTVKSKRMSVILAYKKFDFQKV